MSDTSEDVDFMDEVDSVDDVGETADLPLSGIVANPREILDMKDSSVAKFSVILAGSAEDFLAGKVRGKVDPMYFGGPTTNNFVIIQQLKVYNGDNHSPFPLAINITDGNRKIPYLNKCNTVHDDATTGSALIFAPTGKIKKTVIASVLDLDPADLEVLSTYPYSTTAENISVNCFQPTAAGEQAWWVPRESVIAKELATYPDIAEAMATQGPVRIIPHGGTRHGKYYKLRSEAYETGVKMVKARLDRSPEIDAGALHFEARVVKPELFKRLSGGTYCVVLKVGINYKKSREVGDK